MSGEKVTRTYEELEAEASALTDKVCDLLPGVSKLAVAMMFQALSKQIAMAAPKEWAIVKQILEEGH